MANFDQLRSALKETLEQNGSLNEVRALLRAEIYKTLDDKSIQRPDIPADNFVINELIREYLDFNQYIHTRSVFLCETGQPKEPLGREFLERQIRAPSDSLSASVPLLYWIVTALTKEDQSELR